MRLPWQAKSRDDDIDEWARHHDDPRSEQGYQIFVKAMTEGPLLTDDELTDLWRQANRLVGQRAPSDYGEFLAYGYIEALKDARRTVRS
jgi:hypothetical protein